MGAWKHTVSPTKWFYVKRNEDNAIEEIVPLQGKPGPKDHDVYQLRRVYYVNASDGDVRKIISTLQGKLPFYDFLELSPHDLVDAF